MRPNYELAFNSSFDHNYSQCVEHISEQIISIYVKAPLPIIEKESVIVKVKRLIVRVRNLNKYPGNKKTSEKFINNVDSMKQFFIYAPASAFLKELKIE